VAQPAKKISVAASSCHGGSSKVSEKKQKEFPSRGGEGSCEKIDLAPFYVIPAKAGIQLFQSFSNFLDPGFHPAMSGTKIQFFSHLQGMKGRWIKLNHPHPNPPVKGEGLIFRAPAFFFRRGPKGL
jgi:hypothetical protein